jgi:hypothetical protein
MKKVVAAFDRFEAELHVVSNGIVDLGAVSSFVSDISLGSGF